MADFILIKEGGYFYNVSGNDALLLHKHLGYKLFGNKTFKAGFPVKRLESFIESFEPFSVNYKVYSRSGELVAERQFEENRYEELEPADYTQFLTEKKPPKAEERTAVRTEAPPQNNAVSKYINALSCIINGKNSYTGEDICGINENLKNDLCGALDYLEKIQAIIKAVI
ncbi:MAG: hypothetical protein K2L42_01810 [Clostridia bacterium]|nr:hypothetical protein [Clostridia bacterium]